MYNVLFLCLIGVPVSLVTRQTPDASFAIVSTCVVVCTSITMCLVFVPKVLSCLVHFETLCLVGNASEVAMQG